MNIDKKKINDSISVTNIEVNKELALELSKKEGTYITIEFEDITNFEDKNEVINVLTDELKKILKKIE